MAQVEPLPNGYADFLPVRISPAKVRAHRLRLGSTRRKWPGTAEPEAAIAEGGSDAAQTITAEMIRQIESVPPNDDTAAGSRETSATA